jgi:hypothetical protein
MDADETLVFKPEADLDEIIATYLQEAQAGKAPTPKELITRCPAFAQQLTEFFDAQERFQRVAEPIRAAVTGMPPLGAKVRDFGNYEILEELAHGGMGVVYRARQVRPNRVVALKTILAGQLASADAVRRFKTEAESVANLDHPNIVPIYEVGEHDGQHYFTMKLIEGGSLASRPLPLPGRKAAELLALVARAVHHAHQRGILHRDLKPGNILIDGQGQPHVTDFGLAKRVAGDLRHTQSGAIIGTASYISPEQARSEKELTTVADVYSLGAVLYELLTGRPPFLAETPLDTVLQVLEREPEPPRRINPQVDLDLETICMKCLQKQPGNRYASAEGLAEDLERWLRGEAIEARPVGLLGRFTRWCRRNRAVAGLTGAVAASLLAGTVISTYFAVAANQRANAERAERQRAQAAEDGMEREVALSLIGPLDLKGPRALSLPEVEVLWRLAATTSERLRQRFFEESLRTETAATKLRHRAPWCVHAAVGLDPQRRTRAEQVLAKSMREPNNSLRIRTETAWLALELSDWGSPTNRESAEVIAQGWAAEENAELRDTWREVLLASAQRVAPTEATGLMSQALAQEKNSNVRGQLAHRLAAVVGRLEPAEAARMCANAAHVLTQALVQEEDSSSRYELASGLKAVVGRLEPAEAAGLCANATRVLKQALAQQKDGRACQVLAAALAALAEQMEPAEAAPLLTQELAPERDAFARLHLTQGLAAVAGRLEPAEAARVCAESARLLNRALAEAKGAYARRWLAECLAAVAGLLNRAEAARMCADAAQLLSRALAQEKDCNARQDLAHGLAAVAGRLEPKAAAGMCTEAAKLLSRALAQEKDCNARLALAGGLAAVAGWLEPGEASRVCADAARLLTQALAQEKDSDAHWPLAAGLMLVADRLEPNEAFRLLTQALAQEKEWYPRRRLAHGLAVAAGRLEPKEAARLLTLALAQQKDIQARQQLVYGLDAVSGWLEPAEAARMCAGAARSYNQALDQGQDPYAWPFSVELVSTLFQPLDSESAAHAARVFTVRIVSDPDSSCVVENGLELGRSFNPEVLERFLTTRTRSQIQRRVGAITAALGISAPGPARSLPLLLVATEPLPHRLSTQDLVELLKMPTCVGEVRRVILDHLGNRYGRRFETHWDFVRYAQQQGLDLDFTTPPKRPDRRLPPLFQD